MSAVLTEDEVQAAELVGRIGAGEEAAEEQLVELYSRGVLYLLRHLSRDASLADDLHQETFRIAIEKIRRLEIRQPEKLSAFVRGIARNLWIAEWRRRGRRGTEEPVDEVRELSDPSPGVLSEALRQENRARIRQMLSELRSSRDREILFRFYIAEEPKEALCRRLEITSSQFNVILFRARQRFRQLLEQEAGVSL